MTRSLRGKKDTGHRNMEDNVAVVHCKAARAKTMDYVIKVINLYLPNYINNIVVDGCLKNCEGDVLNLLMV